MKRPNSILMLAAALMASVVLSACGSTGGDMSDEDKIKTMKKAHDVPLGPSSSAGAAGTKTGL